MRVLNPAIREIRHLRLPTLFAFVAHRLLSSILIFTTGCRAASFARPGRQTQREMLFRLQRLIAIFSLRLILNVMARQVVKFFYLFPRALMRTVFVRKIRRLLEFNSSPGPCSASRQTYILAISGRIQGDFSSQIAAFARLIRLIHQGGPGACSWRSWRLTTLAAFCLPCHQQAHTGALWRFLPALPGFLSVRAGCQAFQGASLPRSRPRGRSLAPACHKQLGRPA